MSCFVKPKGGVERGDIFTVEVPNEDPIISPLSTEEKTSTGSAPMVKIRAPVDLEGGFEFKANVKGCILNAKVVSVPKIVPFPLSILNTFRRLVL